MSIFKNMNEKAEKLVCGKEMLGNKKMDWLEMVGMIGILNWQIREVFELCKIAR